MGSNAKVAIAGARDVVQKVAGDEGVGGDAGGDKEGGGMMGGGSAGRGGIDGVAGSTGLDKDPVVLAMEGIEASSVEKPADRLDSSILVHGTHL